MTDYPSYSAERCCCRTGIGKSVYFLCRGRSGKRGMQPHPLQCKFPVRSHRTTSDDSWSLNPWPVALWTMSASALDAIPKPFVYRRDVLASDLRGILFRVPRHNPRHKRHRQIESRNKFVAVVACCGGLQGRGTGKPLAWLAPCGFVLDIFPQNRQMMYMSNPDIDACKDRFAYQELALRET